MTIVVTGAAGTLGSLVVRALIGKGFAVRGVGRSGRPTRFPAQWIQADVVRAEGLDDALRGATSVVHCATDAERPWNDLAAMDRLIERATEAGFHLIYVGIAGISDATSASDYYRVKSECETRLRSSGCAHTLQRSTQFHPFVLSLLERLRFGPIQLVPKMTLQPIDPEFVATRLAEHAVSAPRGLVEDLAGYEPLTMEHMTRSWRGVTQWHGLEIRVPALAALRAMRRLRYVRGEAGGLEWRGWLAAEALLSCND